VLRIKGSIDHNKRMGGRLLQRNDVHVVQDFIIGGGAKTCGYGIQKKYVRAETLDVSLTALKNIIPVNYRSGTS
jgi:hypothetical protein